MTINDAMRTYRLPNPTTPEDLECRWSKVLNFGNRVLLAGYYYNGKNKPSYFGASTSTLRTAGTTAKALSGFTPQARSSSRMTATRLPGRCSSKIQKNE